VNNQNIKLLPYNAPIPLYDKNTHYTRPSDVDGAWPAMSRLRIAIAAQAIFGPAGIFK